MNRALLKLLSSVAVVAAVLFWGHLKYGAAVVFSLATFTFNTNYVDTNYGGNTKPGWVRAGDVDNDGDLDLVAGGGRALFVYENNGSTAGWTRYGSLDATQDMGSNGAVLYDVDKDGDLDAVTARYYDHLGWWECPGSQPSNQIWTWHQLTATNPNYYTHDVILADLDLDGKAEEFIFGLTSGSNLKVEWFRPGADPTQPWERHVIGPQRNHGNNNHAGLDAGDVDGDGDIDLGYSNGWYESPGDPKGNWTWHQVTNVSAISNTLLRDMDGDGDLDLVTGSGHSGSGVRWFANPSWTQNVIGNPTNPEGLQVLDMDGDGDLDVISSELDFSNWGQEVHNVYVFENLGNAQSWNTQNIAPNTYPSHQIQIVDLNEDGKIDLISEAAGYSVITFHENTTSGTTPSVATPTISPNGGTFSGSVTVAISTTTGGATIRYTTDGSTPTASSPLYTNPFTLAQDATVRARGFMAGMQDSAVASASFTIQTGGGGTTFSFSRAYVDTNYGGNGKPGWARPGDMDNDGDLDIVVGGGRVLYVYENDGTAGGWTRHGTLDGTNDIGCNGAALSDVDRDGDLDVVAARFYGNLGWWENPGGTLQTQPWTFHALTATSPNAYTHDMALADLDKDGVAEEFIFSMIASGTVKIEWYRPGADPTQPWLRYVIEPTRNTGGVNFAGLDTGDVDGDGDIDVAFSNGWYASSGAPTGSWSWNAITSVPGISNTLLRDMDGDGDLDKLTASGHSGTGVRWFENPSWTEHLIGNIQSPEGLQAADLDGDGDIDVVAPELDTNNWGLEIHQLYVFENQGNSLSWNAQNVAANIYPNHHLQLADMNADGKLDIVSESAGTSVVSYYENTTGGTTPTVATAVISPNGGTFTSSVSVTITTATGGASIRYTTDGSTPTASSTLYTGPLMITQDATITVRAFLAGMQDSAAATATFTIQTGGGPPPGNGTGLTGEYYNNPDFTQLQLVRYDGAVDFSWGSGSPGGSIDPDGFSIRWTGQVEAQFSETVTFYTTSDDGVRLWVDGVLLIDDWNDHAPLENSGTIALAAGQKVDLVLEYYENTGGAVVTLSWSSASQPKQLIPTNQLYQLDADGDGLSDAAEILFGLNPANSDEDANGIDDGLDDWDGDGTNNQTELAQGAAPGGLGPVGGPGTGPGPGPGPGGGSGSSGSSGGCGATGLELLLAFGLISLRNCLTRRRGRGK